MAKKPNEIKKNFWLLASFFTLLTLTGLVFLWGSALSGHSSSMDSSMSSMMGGTMGSMMSQEQAPITVAELFVQEDSGMMGGMDMEGHHQKDNLLGKMHFALTAVIVTLIPIIFGLLMFVLPLWI